jgi:hypothetical protein
MMKLAFALLVAVPACSLDFASRDDNSADAGNVATVDAYQQVVGTVQHVFVTSALYEGGALGGIGGADAICQLHADTAGLTDASGLLSSYLAWISTSAATPAGRFRRSTAGYQLLDGTAIAANWNDLVSGNLEHAIDVDENGQPFTEVPVCATFGGAWTGTKPNGTLIADADSNTSGEYTCADWTDEAGTALIGDTTAISGQWTDSGCSTACNAHAPLYCVEY